jgi:Skp family chaperone for outer membrane proteins
MITLDRKALWGLLIAAVICLIAASARAQDRTGATLELKKLVESFDKKVESLERNMAKSDDKEKALQEEKEKLVKQFRKEEDPYEKGKVQSAYLEVRAYQNLNGRRKVKFIYESILSMTEDLETMAKLVDESDMNPVALKERRARIAKILVPTGMVVARLRNDMHTPETQQKLQMIEQNLVMYHQLLDAPDTSISAGQVQGQLNKTIETMEDICIQLKLFEEILEYERLTLGTLAPRLIVDGLLAGMAPGGRFDLDISSALNGFWENLMDRTSEDADILSQSVHPKAGISEPRSARYQDTLYKVRNGIPPRGY